MSNLASGGKLWSRDKELKSERRDIIENLLLLIVVAGLILGTIGFCAVGKFGEIMDKVHGKDVSHSISVETSHKSLGEGR
jgi:hypothetical protein